MAMNPRFAIRKVAKSCAVFVLGQESKPRMIISGGSSGYRMTLSPVNHLGYLLGTADAPLHHAIRT